MDARRSKKKIISCAKYFKTRAASVYQNHIRNYEIHDCGKRTSSVLYSLKVALRMTPLPQEAIISNTPTVGVYDALFKNVPLVEVHGSPTCFRWRVCISKRRASSMTGRHLCSLICCRPQSIRSGTCKNGTFLHGILCKRRCDNIVRH